MKSCIEGVEDKSLQDYLRSFGATWFQGYYYSKPVGEEQLKKLLLEEMYNKRMLPSLQDASFLSVYDSYVFQ